MYHGNHKGIKAAKKKSKQFKKVEPVEVNKLTHSGKPTQPCYPCDKQDHCFSTCCVTTPVVKVPKGDRKMRLCSDYKVTINQSLDADQYPHPKPEDLFASLAGGVKFSKN